MTRRLDMGSSDESSANLQKVLTFAPSFVRSTRQGGGDDADLQRLRILLHHLAATNRLLFEMNLWQVLDDTVRILHSRLPVDIAVQLVVAAAASLQDVHPQTVKDWIADLERHTKRGGAR